MIKFEHTMDKISTWTLQNLFNTTVDLTKHDKIWTKRGKKGSHKYIKLVTVNSHSQVIN